MNSIPKYYNPTSYLREYKSLLRVHAQQYQKQQGNSTDILTRSCKFETLDPQGNALLIDDKNTSVLLDSAQPPSTQTPVPSIDSLSPLSTDNTNVPSTDIFHPTSIDIPSRTSIDIEPRDMVVPLILVRDNNGDLHDQEGYMHNAAVVKEEKLQEGDFEVESLMSFGGSHCCRSTPDTEHRSIYTNTNRSTRTPEHRTTTPTESTASCNAVRILTHEEFTAKHPHPHSPDKVRIDRHANNDIDRQSEANIDR
ncbi:hypothetical protein F2Q70_00002289 [Brassica cretica]|uniref:Uncharacterized protein n=1 Tax=Brassica cretica TaxID=69181 RepID=A0A8S9IL05_BRACR|nr:hypothetical protein F2Q70_00002289 [Brassica cretica]